MVRPAFGKDQRTGGESGDQVRVVEPFPHARHAVSQPVCRRADTACIRPGGDFRPFDIGAEKVVPYDALNLRVDNRHCQQGLGSQRMTAQGDAIGVHVGPRTQPIENLPLLKHGQGNVVAAEVDEVTGERIAIVHGRSAKLRQIGKFAVAGMVHRHRDQTRLDELKGLLIPLAMLHAGVAAVFRFEGRVQRRLAGEILFGVR